VAVIRGLLAFVVAVAAAFVLGGDVRAMPSPEEGTRGVGDAYFPDAGNGGYDVEHYKLELRYDPATDRLDGHAVLDAVSTQQLIAFDLDLGPLDIATLEVDGEAAAWKRQGLTELRVAPAHTIKPGAPIRIEMRYSGKPGGPGLDHGFKRTDDGAVVAGEPTSAPDWFPSNDHPRDKATYEFAISVPDGLTAIANGVLDGSQSVGGWTTWRWHEGLPMATYLATMAVGRFRVRTGTAAGVPLFEAISTAVPVDDAAPALKKTGEIVDYFSGLFGPYPFDAVGGIVVGQRLGFALETQTRPVYSPGFFSVGDVQAKTTVVAHELAHQWFGDSVSLHDWKDVWLNEGFASYAEWLWAEHGGVRTAQAAFDDQYRKAPNEVWSRPPGDPGVKDLFGASVYQRGAMTVHALRVAVGDDVFFAIVRRWLSEHRYGTGTAAQFIALADEVFGRPLDDLFTTWLVTPVRPPAPVRR
jgi:aminopeptidase N